VQKIGGTLTLFQTTLFLTGLQYMAMSKTLPIWDYFEVAALAASLHTAGQVGISIIHGTVTLTSTDI